MSYEVLARRYRPQTFDDVVGQAPVTTSLRNALRQERLPHALLLAGPRGTGKTSIARILALSLNCDDGPTEKPCGQCASCADIVRGNSLDVQEIDAASNTGVDSVREIRESIRYAAAPGKYRIYIIDEVHMLSQAAFNALLKTLEEPPARSLFVFATTDAQRIPATVLSRVQRFDLKRLGRVDQLDRLRAIAASEGISVSEGVLRALARESEGSLRDALTLLDRLVSALGDAIDETEATRILDLVDHRLVVGIADAILASDSAAALAAVRGATERGVEPMRLATALLGEFRDLLVARIAPDAGELIDAAPDEVEAFRERARPHDSEALQRLFRVLLTRLQDFGFAPRPEHALEMAVVRLASLPDAASLASLLERLDGIAARPAGGEGGSEPPSGGGARTSDERATRPRPSATPEGRAGRQKRDARMRNEARDHPAVKRVIESLDAELREVRLPQGDA